MSFLAITDFPSLCVEYISITLFCKNEITDIFVTFTAFVYSYYVWLMV